MGIADKRLSVGFRKADECVALISNALNEATEFLNFEYPDEVRSVTEGMSCIIPLLLYAHILEKFEIGLAEETIQILFDYYDDNSEDDELDMSFLKLIPLKPERITLNIVLCDEDHAKYLGIDKLPELSTEHILIVIAKKQEESERSDDEQD